MQMFRPGPARDYAVAVAAVALTAVVRLMLYGPLHGNLQLVLFVPAVLVAGGVGGFGPGIAATVLSLVAGLRRFRRGPASPPPRWSTSPPSSSSALPCPGSAGG